MSLYVVVHHQQDPIQNWANGWLDNERLESITTTAEISQMCHDAMENGERVFVHRCGWGDARPVICCSANVMQSSSIDHGTSLVIFGEQQVLGVPPPVMPYPGQNYYRV
jgi:hypothetical protein